MLLTELVLNPSYHHFLGKFFKGDGGVTFGGGLEADGAVRPGATCGAAFSESVHGPVSGVDDSVGGMALELGDGPSAGEGGRVWHGEGERGKRICVSLNPYSTEHKRSEEVVRCRNGHGEH